MNLHYISRGFLGGSRGAGAGMDILPSIPAAPRPCTSSPRSHISELCHLRIPQRHIRAVPCPGGPGPAINQPGLPPPRPCAMGPLEQPGCPIFPVHPPLPLAKRWMQSWSPDVLLMRGTRDGVGPSGNGWASCGEPGTEGTRPLCAGISSAAGAHPRHPRAG